MPFAADDPLNTTYDVPRPVKVVIASCYVKFSWKSWLNEKLENCNIVQDKFGDDHCWPVSDQNTADADVVVLALEAFRRPEFDVHLPKTKPPGQLWIATCYEPQDYLGQSKAWDCNRLNDPSFMANFDGVASYDATSKVPTFYQPPSEDVLRRAPPDFDVQMPTGGRALATMFSADGRARYRIEWAEALSGALVAKRGLDNRVAMYGGAFPDTSDTEPECEQIKGKAMQYANRCAARPFALISENSMTPWCVTEKIWVAFASGSIPIYNGPPEVKQLVPPNSMIFAGDYETIEDLADAVLSADRESMYAWKKLPTKDWGMWREARRHSLFSFAPRVCELAARSPGLKAAERPLPWVS